MNILRENNHKSQGLSRGRIFLGVVVVFSLCISASNAGIGRIGGGISAFASIFVNDREIDVDNAVIVIDGQPAVEADLRLGHVVLVKGDLDEQFPIGTATEVIVEDAVEGPIASIDANNEQLVVLGQTVITDGATIFDTQSASGSLTGLNVNDVVEVSGFFTNEGNVLATRVEQKAAGGIFEVTGVVGNLTAATFSINALVVDFSGAVLKNFPTSSIAEGDFVEAKGDTLGTNGELIATRLELKDDVAGIPGELGEFEGLITDFESASSFSLARIPVMTNGQTAFEGGGPANLTANVSVEVEGVFDANGILVADRVIIRGTRIEVEGLVDDVHLASFTILGINISVDSTTRLKDKSKADLDHFTLSDLSAGDFVELRSFKNPPASNPVHAERVRRDDPESETELQGFVSSVNSQNFELQGTTIEVTQQTEFRDADDEEISGAEFFAVLTTGTFVKLDGSETSSTVIVATEIELELDD